MQNGKKEEKKKADRGHNWCQSTWIREKVNVYQVLAKPAHALQEKQIPLQWISEGFLFMAF